MGQSCKDQSLHKPGAVHSAGLAAESLRITGPTLYRLIDEGKVPACKFGRVIRLSQADVEVFIEAAKIEPGTLKHLHQEAAEPAADDLDEGQNDG